MSLLSLILSLNFPATAEDETVPVPVAVLVGLVLDLDLVDPWTVRSLVLAAGLHLLLAAPSVVDVAVKPLVSALFEDLGLALVPALVDPRIVRPLAPPAVLDQEFAVITNAMDAAASYPDSALSVVDSAPDLDLDSTSALVLEWNTD